MVQKSGDHQLRLVVYPIICRSCFYMVQILFHQQYGVIGMLILPHFLGLKKSPWKHGPQCCQHCRFVHGKGHITLHRLANTKGQNLSIEMVGLAILRMRTQHLPDISRLFHKNLGKMLRIWHMFFGRGAHPEFTRFHLPHPLSPV